MYPTHPDMQDAPRGPGVLCRNASDFGVCNWFVSDQDSDFCLSCTLNHTIPNLLEPDRRRWWKSLEQAKRRLIYSLLSLQLPVVSKAMLGMGWHSNSSRIKEPIHLFGKSLSAQGTTTG